MFILLLYKSIDIDVNGIFNSSDEVVSYNDTLDFNTSFRLLVLILGPNST